MRFAELIDDIERLRGNTLQSIRTGANITVNRVNREKERIEITTSNGESRNRAFSEIQRLWEELNSAPAIHVDSTLGGSGTSRNQPETLLANLPYIEYLTVRRKKHIAYIGRNSHPPGTLKEMDLVAAESVRDRLTRGVRYPVVMMVFQDINKALDALERILGTKPEPVHQGAYRKLKDGMEILVVSKHTVPAEIEVGTYPVLRTNTPSEDSLAFRVGGHDLLLTNRHGLKLILEKA